MKRIDALTSPMAMAGVTAASLLLPFLPWERHGLLASCLGTHPLGPEQLWAGWSLAPEILLPLAALAVVVQRAMRAGASWGLGLGLLLVVIALVSPLCRLAATLVSAHMLQFMILCIAAPILLAPLAGVARLPLVPVAVIYAGVIWVWHLSPVYAAILNHAAVHLVAVGVLLGTSILFWRSLIGEIRERPLAALAVLLLTLCHTGILGAWLTFSVRPWYPFLEDAVALWGLALIEDQQLAGLLMWFVGGAAYLLAALHLATRALRPGLPADTVDSRS